MDGGVGPVDEPHELTGSLPENQRVGSESQGLVF
jgi:hypothetical protein